MSELTGANQLANLLVLYLTTPATDFYVTKIIQKSSNPTLEPFNTNNIDLGSFSVMGSALSVSLESLSIRGLSNIQIAKENSKPKITINGDQITFYAVRPNTEAPPTGIPPNLIINTQIKITSDGDASPLVPIVITVLNGNLVGVFNASGDASIPDTVRIKFTIATVQADATPANITFDLSQLDSFTKPMIEGYLNQTSTLTMLIQKLNGELASQSVLNSLSQGATQAAQSTLQSIITT